MIFLILCDYTARRAGAAKISMYQAINVMLKFFCKEKLENSGKTKTEKMASKYEGKLSGPMLAVLSNQGSSSGMAQLKARSVAWCHGEHLWMPFSEPSSTNSQGDVGMVKPWPSPSPARSRGLSEGWVFRRGQPHGRVDAIISTCHPGSPGLQPSNCQGSPNARMKTNSHQN